MLHSVLFVRLRQRQARDSQRLREVTITGGTIWRNEIAEAWSQEGFGTYQVVTPRREKRRRGALMRSFCLRSETLARTWDMPAADLQSGLSCIASRLAIGFAIFVASAGAAASVPKRTVESLRHPIAGVEEPRTPQAIHDRIEELAGHQFAAWSKDADVDYPPERVELRVFKTERELEIWAANGDDALKPVARLDVCALDDQPGTKLRQGDGKTPEGRFRAHALYPSRYYWMWMKLDPESIDEPGRPGTGSAFRLCLDYPRKEDRARSRAKGFANPGGGICLHGNCVSDGCVSFTNRDFLAVFAFAMHHDRKRHGPMVVDILPSREDRRR
ncbi:MAG: L,D-transpeptidase family protein [Myxococcota bacterium]